MPTLNQYVPSSDKSGYYIRANVGVSYPITLQLTGLGTQILKEAEFSDGDVVPTKLVWSMFDIGLLYTQSTHNVPEDQSDIHSAFVAENISAKLTAETKGQLIQYLDTYEGESLEKVQKLKQNLEAYQPTEDRSDNRETHTSDERFGTAIPVNTDELISVLFTWSGVNSSRSFRQLKKRVEIKPTRIINSVQSFFQHPLLTPQADVTHYCSVEYTLETSEWGEIVVEDCRYLVHVSDDRDDVQLRVSFPEIDDISSPIPVVDGNIQSDDVEQVDKAEFMSEVLEPIEPVDSVSADSVKHGLDKLEDLADLNEEGEFILRDIQSGFRHQGTELPEELVKDLESAEAVDIEPMGRIPSSADDGVIHVKKVDRISNSGNPVVELPGNEHTILPKGEAGGYYFIELFAHGKRSRAFAKIVVSE